MFHKSNFGEFGANLTQDLDGYVPQRGDTPDKFRWLGLAWDGWGTDAEEWRGGDGYPCTPEEAEEEWEEWIEASEEAIREAEVAIDEWRTASV